MALGGNQVIYELPHFARLQFFPEDLPAALSQNWITDLGDVQDHELVRQL
jgi:hypothetical protein